MVILYLRRLTELVFHGEGNFLLKNWNPDFMTWLKHRHIYDQANYFRNASNSIFLATVLVLWEVNFCPKLQPPAVWETCHNELSTLLRFLPTSFCWFSTILNIRLPCAWRKLIFIEKFVPRVALAPACKLKVGCYECDCTFGIKRVPGGDECIIENILSNSNR